MPIYEYLCPKCGEFEFTQRITEPPLKKCPTCKGKVKKLISNTSFQLKGSGWYVTDYGGKKSGAKETAAKDGASSEGASKDGGGAATDGGGSASGNKDKPTAKDKTPSGKKAA
jgi:putative FmdB family regulatory protein